MTTPFTAEPETAEDAPETPPEDEAPPADPSGLDPGWWLTCPPKVARKGVLQAVTDQKSYRAYRRAHESRWQRLRQGERGLTVETSAQDDDYFVRRGFEAGSIGPGPNIADQLIRRTAAVLTVDPPLPTINANSDDATERQASELAERILRVEGSDAERNDAGFLAQAIDQAGTYGSQYAYFCVNPQGGGLEPVKIQAHPAATTTQDALTPMGPPQIDPMTGAEIPGLPLDINEADITWRYVRADGSLTDVEAEAQMAWQPKVARHLLSPANVTLLPAGADGETATGCVVGRLVTLGEIIARFYDGVRPDKETVKKLANWKPNDVDWKEWVPPVVRETLPQTPPARPDEGTGEKEITDDALCPLLTLYLVSQGQAPMGAYIAIGGPDEPLYRGEWRKVIGEGEKARVEHFPLPVVQFKCLDDPNGDPNGLPLIEALAAESNIDATLTEYVLNYTWRASNPHVFMPPATSFQPEAFKARTGDPVTINEGGKPEFEVIPQMDRAVYDVWEKNREGLQKSSGLSATVASGAQDASVTSGLQQRLVSEETRVGLSTTAQNRDRFIVGCWRTLLVFIRAFYETPRQLEYTGESGDVQVASFAGIELEGAGDLQIAKGSGTLLSPTAKLELAREELQLAITLQDPEGIARWQEQMVSNQSRVVGLQDDPVRARMARQIQQIKDLGKQALPDAIEEPPPMVDPMGQPIPQPPTDPVSQQAAQIFAPNVADDMPQIAPMRYRMLRDLVQSKSYESADARIQQAITAEFQRMRQAAGVVTVAEQQAAAQQQAMQAQQSKIAEIDAKKSKDPLPGVPGPDTGPNAAPAPDGPPPAGPEGVA